MQRKKLFLSLFLALTIVNLCIFFFRDHFRYQSHATYQSLYESCDERCRDKWENYVFDYPRTELNEAKAISDSLVKGKTSTFEKVVSIGHFLSRNFRQQLGQPTVELICSTPLSQFRQLHRYDSIQLWCSNFAQVFSYFCWSQDIVSRNIGIMKPGDNHVISECYLPELEQWVMVDLTNNILAAKLEGKDSVANFVDFRRLVNNHPNIYIWRSSNDSVVGTLIDPTPLRHYYKESHPALFYQSMNYAQKITTGNKIRQYLFPVSWYDILLEKKGNNFLFYLKLALLILWALTFFVFLFSRTKFKI